MPRPRSDQIELQGLDQAGADIHTALHELGHASGHPDRLNRSTLVKHGGFGPDAYAREELRAEIAAMMTGEQLGVGHEPRHGTAYVSSWIKVLENDPKEIRAAAVDAQRMSDRLMTRERERSKDPERAAHKPSGRENGTIREPGEPTRSAAVPVAFRDSVQMDPGAEERAMPTLARPPDSSEGERARDNEPSR